MLEIDRPPLLFPDPALADRAKRPPARSSIRHPSVSRQSKRLAPQFSRLTRAFEIKTAELRESPDNIAPELTLVFETIGSRANFMSAVKRIDGLEWLAEYSEEGVRPDSDFYDEENPDKDLPGKVFCIMSDRRALDELLSCWKRYSNDEDVEFDRGYASLKDIFVSLKEVRVWSARDRFEDTGVVDQWKEDLELRRGSPIPFEIELFYRSHKAAQQRATAVVRQRVENAGGRITDICVIDDIGYHGIAAWLPPERIEELVNGEIESIELAKTDQIMFFRPVSQALAVPGEASGDGFLGADSHDERLPAGNPVIALFDGLPVANHRLLQNRIILDDPDGFDRAYPVNERKHGTEMASLVVHGDLDNPLANSLDRPLYVRPIMKPAFMKESFPEGVLVVDLIHRAVVRMFEGDRGEPPAAPHVCVVNLSIGDSQRQYLNSVSPLARLLDWLSFKYQVLFVVSAGNTHDYLRIDGLTAEAFAKCDVVDRTCAVVDSVKQARRNLRLFSPSESVNAITVGALSDDFSQLSEKENIYRLVEDGIPAPYSAVGPGVNRAIKPELYMPGGRLMVQGIGADGKPFYAQQNSSGPGCRTAYPAQAQPMIGEGYSLGTSDSAALLSHAAGPLYEMLDEVFLRAGQEGVPREYAAVLLKAALSHGACWDSLEHARNDYYCEKRNRAARWIGYGVPDFSKVMTCSMDRVTAIGFGKLKNDKAHEYHLPLPVDLHSRAIKRKVTATLAYMTPISFCRQEYRKAQLWFSLNNVSRIAPDRVNTDWHAVLRGTLQHEVFEGGRAIPWGADDEIDFKVSCKQSSTTGPLGAEVPYAFFATVEFAEPVGDIYAGVADRLKQKVPLGPSEQSSGLFSS